MTWTNIGSFQTSKTWLYSSPFTGDSIRVRHILSTYPQNLPWKFYGLIAQVFGYPNAIEFFNIRRLYPKDEHDVLVIPNPFPNRERRIAIKGQRRYQTAIVWTTFIDAWDGVISLGQESLQQSIDSLAQDIRDNNDLIAAANHELLNASDEDSNQANELLPPGYYF